MASTSKLWLRLMRSMAAVATARVRPQAKPQRCVVKVRFNVCVKYVFYRLSA